MTGIAIIVAIGLALWALIGERNLRHRVDAKELPIGSAPAAGERRVPTPPIGEPVAAVTAPAPVARPALDGFAVPPPTAPADESAVELHSPWFRRWEQRLVENWLVWAGGVTLALGGAFLVKLSIDHGLLTPPVRIVLAALLGIALVGAGDWIAQRDADQPTRADSAPVPQALVASGAAIVFAAVYAAYQLYGLLPGALAFPLLAATAAVTTAMSLRHGPYVAALGLVGAYVVPALVTTQTPHALPLFGYLVAVTAAALVLLRHRGWWWLAWLSLAGAIVWPPVWLASQSAHPEAPIVAAYLLALLGLFAAFRRGISRIGFLSGIVDAAPLRVLVRVAFWLIAAMMIVVVHADGFTTTTVAAVFLVALSILWFAHRDVALDDVIAVAGALLLAILATWELPVPTPQTDLSLYGRPPAEIAHFLVSALLAAGLLGGTGFAVLRTAERSGRWAALSAAALPVFLLIAYWRLHRLAIDLDWSSAALALAAIELGAAAIAARWRDGAIEREIAFASYAIGVLSGTILGATFAFSEAWLSVALALHLPAMGWIEGRVRAPVIRWLALSVAGVVLVRLVLNPYMLQYPLSAPPIFNWLLYGYGVPALAFIVATRQFGGRADDLLVAVLEGGSALFTTALLTLDLRHALYGRIDAPFTDLARDSTQPLLWLGVSAGLLWLGERRRRPVLLYSGVMLFGIAMLQVMLWQALIANPFFTGEPIGRTPILDALTPAYALPAICCAAIWTLGLGPREMRQGAQFLAPALGLLWLSLEIRHLFRGSVVACCGYGEAEWYSYSAAWLAVAAAALAAGLYRRSERLRQAALIGIGFVAAKVFLSDLAELSGILRALSFLGLGAVLIGIGYAYRRLRPTQTLPAEIARSP